jgi:hypothetical protein
MKNSQYITQINNVERKCGKRLCFIALLCIMITVTKRKRVRYLLYSIYKFYDPQLHDDYIFMVRKILTTLLDNHPDKKLLTNLFVGTVDHNDYINDVKFAKIQMHYEYKFMKNKKKILFYMEQ